MYPGMNTAKHQDLIMNYTDELVECVNETRRICKALLHQGLLSEDKYRTIIAAPSSQDRMKQLLQALSSKGQQGRNALYKLLQEYEPELTLQLEHALYVHGVKHMLIQSVKQVEQVANRMLTQGLITEEEYFQVCEEEGHEARMHAMFRVLEQQGTKKSDGFYNALFHCEPLLYRELEKARVLQMCELETKDNQSVNLMNQTNLEKKWTELENKEKQLEKQKEELRKEWELLEKRQAEVDQDRKQVLEMKLVRMTGQWEHLNNNGYSMST